jgi:hypothetical protein
MTSIPEPAPHVQSEPLCCGPEWRPAFDAESEPWSEADEAWYVQNVSQRYSDPAELKPGNLSDLAKSVAGYLTGLGLEPDVEDGLIRVQFLGRMVELSFEDIDARLELMAAEGRDGTPWWD